MAEFALKNNIFEFNGKVKQQVVGTAIGTKFASPYACIYMDEVETKFLKTQEYAAAYMVSIYIYDIFFIWNHSKDELNKFLENRNISKSHLTFTNEISKDNTNFLDLNVSIRESRLVTDLPFKEMDHHQYLHYQCSHPEHKK